jgi:hypothetical protein
MVHTDCHSTVTATTPLCILPCFQYLRCSKFAAFLICPPLPYLSTLSGCWSSVSFPFQA